ncbi:outer membrane protein [Pseudohongiella nitratireducens]|uniref:Outer membrane protein n=2 Tax=Pseudohongiella nitratireducens TaxID=1768907 RepID=A0A917LTS8_9GAMM|nr:TonB-dependent receptor [Pseudohongiella nitratireducens]GGG57427.1 outer membrane protein [Pseudohongiella nitratireducens]
MKSYPHCPFRRNRLALSVAGLTLPLSLFSLNTQAQSVEEADERIPVVLVTLGLDENARQVSSPYELVDADDLLSRSGTLGDILENLPGVRSDTFGGGASRPVIRGQGAPRVEVLSDGSGVIDASSVSPDHAVSLDTMLSRRIEVLRGPASLQYGGGAIGGVVNILDNKIPNYRPEDGADATFILRGDTVAGERAGAMSLTAPLGENFAWHAEATYRDADAYQSPASQEKRVQGTAAKSENAAMGFSWVEGDSYLGISYSVRNDEYGIPGHSEAHLDCHPHGIDLHCGGHDDHEEEHDEDHEDEHDEDHDEGHEGDHDHGTPWVDLESERIDLRGEFDAPMDGIHRIRIRASHTDYGHVEIEGDEIITRYRNDGYEGRVEIDHEALGGWHGIVGFQVSDNTLSSQGNEAFIPEIDASSYAVFAIEHRELTDNWHLEAGIRLENQSYDPTDSQYASFDEDLFSYSAASVWSLGESHSFTVGYAHAERAPAEQELYASGIHLATATYECGLLTDPAHCGNGIAASPEAETSGNIELSIARFGGPLTYSLHLYQNSIDDYIYAQTLAQEGDFRLIRYVQRDAEFTGFEAEVGYQFSQNFGVELFHDEVRGRLDDGGNLPRISPARTGATLSANGLISNLDAELTYFHVAEQDDIAGYESVTSGYDMLNLQLDWQYGMEDEYHYFIKASNLLDEDVWNHTSFLADTVPLPGRNISAGLRFDF